MWRIVLPRSYPADVADCLPCFPGLDFSSSSCCVGELDITSRSSCGRAADFFFAVVVVVVSSWDL